MAASASGGTGGRRGEQRFTAYHKVLDLGKPHNVHLPNETLKPVRNEERGCWYWHVHQQTRSPNNDTPSSEWRERGGVGGWRQRDKAMSQNNSGVSELQYQKKNTDAVGGSSRGTKPACKVSSRGRGSRD